MTVTGRLAGFASDRTVTVPPEEIRLAGDVLVDTAGVALAGLAEEVVATARRAFPDLPPGPAAVWGTEARTRPAEAAFFNAVAVHALDYDDSSPSLRGHPSATLIPAVVAAGEAARSCGRDVLAAYAIGLEVAARVSSGLGAAHYLHGWHTTATAGIFGATAGAARLLGLTADQIRHAFGLAAAQASGLTRNFGSMAKPFQVGFAARAAIDCALLARAGATADPDILDGPQGFFDAFGCGTPVPDEAALADLGDRWTLSADGVYTKRWPCCYAVHRPVAGLRELIAEGLDPDAVTSVEVGFLPGVDHPLLHSEPTDGLQAKFSIEYAMAAVLLDGDIGIGSFDDAMVRRPAVRERMARVGRFAIPHASRFNGLTGWSEIVVEANGRRIERRIDRTPGSPDWRLTPDEQTAKFLDCATRAMPRPEAEALLARLGGTAHLPDIRSLFDSVNVETAR